MTYTLQIGYKFVKTVEKVKTFHSQIKTHYTTWGCFANYGWVCLCLTLNHMLQNNPNWVIVNPSAKKLHIHFFNFY